MGFVKTCTKCGKTKPIEEFYKSECRKYGVQSWCMECQKKESRKRYVKNLTKKQAFLEKVSDYLMLDFVMDYGRRKFDDISELESRALRVNGGLSEMWSRVHNLDYPCKISTIIKELSEFYDNNYTREQVENRQQIENRTGCMKSIGEILKLN